MSVEAGKKGQDQRKSPMGVATEEEMEENHTKEGILVEVVAAEQPIFGFLCRIKTEFSSQEAVEENAENPMEMEPMEAE